MTREEFKKLFDNHFGTIRNYIYYRSGDQELATDVAQETFLRVWEKQPDLLNGNIKGLLYKIAGDVFISLYRKRKSEMKFIAVPMGGENLDLSPEEHLQFKEMNRNFEKALSDLPEKQRTVFLMHRMEGLKYNEIAGALGLSVKAVEKRMNLALIFLRKVIER